MKAQPKYSRAPTRDAYSTEEENESRSSLESENVIYHTQMMRSCDYDILSFQTRDKKNSLRHFFVASVCVAVFTNIILVIIIYLGWRNQECTRDSLSSGGSFKSGFDTEFGPAKKYIQLEQRKFYGAPVIDDDGGMYLSNLDPIRYFGDPAKHPEVDKNWKKLVDGRFFRITEQEARQAWGEDHYKYWHYDMDGYVVGLEVFHALHCLDYIRTTFWPETYFPSTLKGEKKATEHMVFHRDHCLEVIRQYVMCHADLSPIPSIYYKGLGRNYNVLSNVSHTCRNFEKIQDWQMARYNGSCDDAVARNPEGAPNAIVKPNT
ncbi:uncharacterized protein CTRU02_214774 [Colletotrichum truncatum]|uniref:Uncharacterized protein n=1 Tax=Colletotrichum truncatum TaxID=5467 RepID=A0ACC3YFQ4_COLTU|nr:uncharacterized protein CTRU02_09723 [Colletotrichum truncatum]KAF6788405.1 hypothetical protein CTRU02_09723 [Colletotrichum truncatum]